MAGKCIDDNGIIRTGPGDDFDRVAQIPKDVKVLINGRYKEWLKIKLGDKNFWIHEESMEMLPQETVFDEPVLKQIKCNYENENSVIEFNLNQKCAFSLNDVSSPPALIITFYNATSCIGEIIYNLKDDIIKDMEFIENMPGYVKLKINLKNNKIWGYEGDFADNNFILTIKGLPEFEKNSLKNITVILDAGHGGSDPGAVGEAGLTEKEANLNIALELKKMLEERGAGVILTRDADKELMDKSASAYEELKSRVDIGKNNKGTLFISIHNNAMPDPKDGLTAKGTYTYFYRLQSLELAKCITQSLKDALQEEKAAYIYRSFHVIRQTYMPAVLVEVTFISNPGEEKKLTDSNYIKKCALGIYEGILKFIEEDANVVSER